MTVGGHEQMEIKEKKNIVRKERREGGEHKPYT